MRNELYNMAVVNFLKAYELLKRSGQGEGDDEVFGNLVNISICIALCQKEMGSVEEASNILRATMDSISGRENVTVTLQEWYTFVCCKVAEILIQTHKYQEAHEMVTEGLGSIKSPKDSVKYMRRFVELVSLKCEIWEILGYHEDALNLQKKIHQIITTKLIKLKGQNLSASINSNSTPSFDHKDYISDQNY